MIHGPGARRPIVGQNLEELRGALPEFSRALASFAHCATRGSLADISPSRPLRGLGSMMPLGLLGTPIPQTVWPESASSSDTSVSPTDMGGCGKTLILLKHGMSALLIFHLWQAGQKCPRPWSSSCFVDAQTRSRPRNWSSDMTRGTFRRGFQVAAVGLVTDHGACGPRPRGCAERVGCGLRARSHGMSRERSDAGRSGGDCGAEERGRAERELRKSAAAFARRYEICPHCRHRQIWPVSWLSAVPGASRPRFPAWLGRPASTRARSRQARHRDRDALQGL